MSATRRRRHENLERPGSRPWRRRPVAIGTAVALVALVGGGVFVALSGSSGSTGTVLVERTGAPAPAFSLPELSTPAGALTLAALRGKDLVLNFWASWCFPCQTEMPILESAYRSEDGQVRFVGIDSNDARDAAVRFLHKVHATYPSLFDPSGQVANAYHLYGLPTTLFISPRGTVLGRHIGQLDAATLQAALREAFGLT